MKSKHGSPSTSRQLGQYFLSIYKKYPLNADIWTYSTLFKYGPKFIKHTKNFLKGVGYGEQAAGAYQSRALEDDEDLFVRDLDAEEFFGREYDLDERGIIDDLD